jgi:hypothetical protein
LQERLQPRRFSPRRSPQQQTRVNGIRHDQPIESMVHEASQRSARPALAGSCRPSGLVRQQRRRGTAGEGEGKAARTCFE